MRESVSECGTLDGTRRFGTAERYRGDGGPLAASSPHCAITGVASRAAATTAYGYEAVERAIVVYLR